jgi:hypothetical protein
VSSGDDLPSPELRALALFAEALADPAQRREFANEPLGLMRSAMGRAKLDFDQDLSAEARQAFTELFGDMSYEELRLLSRLQQTMVGLDPEQALGLTDRVQTASHATVAKL